jgi:hypothetical protein
MPAGSSVSIQLETIVAVTMAAMATPRIFLFFIVSINFILARTQPVRNRFFVDTQLFGIGEQ